MTVGKTVLKLNKFADWWEYDLLLGVNQFLIDGSPGKIVPPTDEEYAAMEKTDLEPINYLEREEKNRPIGPVYDVATQKTYCAASYAIVVAETVSALSARIQGNFKPLSPQQVLDCSSDFDIMSLKVRAEPVNNGCLGGYM
jgi:hypothetical protein